LRPGRRVAMVGPSGAGKTTVANVLVRFRDLDCGRMTVDGIDVRALDQDDVRRLVGLAAQDAHLFDTTIAENVRLARPGASDDEVGAALHRARAGDWIATLPDGLATRVGERGNRVSGGQRQRIALARVLLAATPVVVLDEPMANLDAATADVLLEDVLAATAGRALLVITHRLAGLEQFDEIVVLDRGRAVERGTHQDLLASGGLYRRLWDLEQDAAAVVVAATAEPVLRPR
ncbi:MAG TPA: ABC transporter ATP-binding protein, partial [Acidimicrobiales bacterium]|nr:ABC transporter ATP-binding protein [Acidimicrobiales bacterium]